MSDFSINTYEVQVESVGVHGFWLLKIYRMNDPETDFSTPIGDCYLGESDTANAGINSPFRMKATDFEERYRSKLHSAVWSVILKHCPDFPGG